MILLSNSKRAILLRKKTFKRKTFANTEKLLAKVLFVLITANYLYLSDNPS